MAKGFISRSKRQGGFTLIELIVVVLVIGILAAIAVPQYFKVVEKGKFAEPMQWINGVKGAQERYLAKNGIYFSGTIASNTFDANLGNMVHFAAGATTTTTVPDWAVIITRNTPCPVVYGCYTVTYTAPPGTIVCSSTDCTADLAPN